MLPGQRISSIVSQHAIKKAAFFDRDGIINVNHGYVHSIEKFEFMDGIVEVMLHVQSLGYDIVVVTNQSGIARGMYTEDEFMLLNKWMCEQLIEQGIVITQTYFCPHHPSVGDSIYTKDCECRKPKAGMLFQAAKDYDFKLERSIFIGDNRSDMESAIAAKIRSGYWLTSTKDRGKVFTILSQHSNLTTLYQINELRECLHLI